MMESLAYLYLALADQAHTDANHALGSSNLKLLEQAFQQKLSSRASIYFLSLVVPLLVLGIADGALAVVKQGDSGPEVTALQKRLQKLGYFNAGVTSNFGSQTKDAVIRFQQDNGLTPDGVVGGDTKAALFDSSRKSSQGSYNREGYNPNSYRGSVGQGESDENVRYLQQQLTEKGFYSGPIDGVNGSETKRAVSEFQASVGLKADGVAGTQTRLALDQYSGRVSTTPERNYPGYTYEAPGRDRQVERTYSNSGPYVVAVPGDRKTLRLVHLSGNDNAFLAQARQGSYVNAGSFDNRAKAESSSEQLRSQGFDARVVYLR